MVGSEELNYRESQQNQMINKVLSKLLSTFWLFRCLPLIAGTESTNLAFQEKIEFPTVPVMIKAIVEGYPMALMFDTGASTIAIDSEWSHKLEWPDEKASIEDAFGRTLNVKKGKLGSVVLQNFLCVNAPAILGDFTPYSRKLGRRIDGVFGADNLQKLIVDFNFDEKTISAKLTSEPETVRRSIEHLSAGSLPAFYSTLFDRPLEFIIDSGSNGSIELPAGMFDDYVKAGLIKPGRIKSIGHSLGGARHASRGWFNKGELMGKPLRGVTVSAGGRGRLGLRWLSQFNFSIDFQKKELRYEPRVNYNAVLAGMSVGWDLSFEVNGAVVDRLRPDGKSPAEEAGIRIGDRIEAIGSLDVSKSSLADLNNFVAENAGRRVQIVLFRGEQPQRVVIDFLMPTLIYDEPFFGDNFL